MYTAQHHTVLLCFIPTHEMAGKAARLSNMPFPQTPRDCGMNQRPFQHPVIVKPPELTTDYCVPLSEL